MLNLLGTAVILSTELSLRLAASAVRTTANVVDITATVIAHKGDNPWQQ
jgi:hypothetical protein